MMESWSKKMEDVVYVTSSISIGFILFVANYKVSAPKVSTTKVSAARVSALSVVVPHFPHDTANDTANAQAIM